MKSRKYHLPKLTYTHCTRSSKYLLLYTPMMNDWMGYWSSACINLNTMDKGVVKRIIKEGREYYREKELLYLWRAGNI